jgi:dTDP-4-amino-4,6-dideoxygalactose transaminase
MSLGRSGLKENNNRLMASEATSMQHIGFNKPYLTGKELEYIKAAVDSSKISGDGNFTKKCHAYFEKRYGFLKTLLTTSCTDALEMAAILIDTQPGDEIIMPGYTFVSTANAFVLRGAKIVFADSCSTDPNIDVSKIEALITKKTKAIVPVHYAGVACNMEAIMGLADEHKLFVIEDAAQAIDSFYKNKPLGSIGNLAAFSFHETKNIISGEGGMIVINDKALLERAEIIREKGTNRSMFFRGEVDKYGWVDIGSSFLPSDIIAAFLYAQLENLDNIQEKRKQIWNYYHDGLKDLEAKGLVQLPHIPAYATNNAHMYYMVCKNVDERTGLINALKAQDINAVFHYLSLQNSAYYSSKHDGRILANTDHFSNCLVRLPMYYQLSNNDQDRIIEIIRKFYKQA